jgi:TonB family protein
MTSGPRAVLTLNLTAITAGLMLLCQPATAQTEPAAADKSLERAQKAADAVFHWIKLNGDKGANRQAPAPAPAAPAPAPAPVARKPAAAPAPVATAPKPAPAAAPAAAPAVAAAPAPVAASPVVAAVPTPEPERPLLLAAAQPTPSPAAPLATAARAVEPPPPPPAEEEAEVPLKLLSRVNPGIPRQLQQTSFRDGYARVKFTVAPNGTVSKAEVLGASHSRLGISAVDAVKQWRFAPIPTPREVAIEFAFNNLDD